MEKGPIVCKRFLGNAFPGFLSILFVCFFSLPSLFAATITNEGKTTEKVNGRSNQGILGAISINPGQTLTLKQATDWIEHVPTYGAAPVRLKIVENDGRTGSIETPGGRYTFQKAAAPKAVVEKKVKSQGLAANHSNVAMSLNFIDSHGGQNFLVLRSGQNCSIPADTTQVRVDQYGWASGDAQISLSVKMPDGRERVVQTSHAVIGSDPQSDQ